MKANMVAETHTHTHAAVVATMNIKILIYPPPFVMCPMQSKGAKCALHPLMLVRRHAIFQ